MKNFYFALLLASAFAGNSVSAQTDTNRGGNNVVWKPQTVLAYTMDEVVSPSWENAGHTSFAYDQYGNTTMLTRYDSSGKPQSKTTYVYDTSVAGYLLDRRVYNLTDNPDNDLADSHDYYHEDVTRDGNGRVVSAKYKFDESGSMGGSLDVEYDNATGKAKKMTVTLGEYGSVYNVVLDNIEWESFDGTRLKVDPYMVSTPELADYLLEGSNRIKSSTGLNVEYLADGGYVATFKFFSLVTTIAKSITDNNGSYTLEKLDYTSSGKVSGGVKTVVTLDSHGNVVNKQKWERGEEGEYNSEYLLDKELTCQYTYNADFGYPETRVGNDMENTGEYIGKLKLEYRDFVSFKTTGISGVATDNAEYSDGIYNLNGVKMPTAGALPKGIYLKRINSKTVKILK